MMSWTRTTLFFTSVSSSCACIVVIKARISTRYPGTALRCAAADNVPAIAVVSRDRLQELRTNERWECAAGLGIPEPSRWGLFSTAEVLHVTHRGVSCIKRALHDFQKMNWSSIRPSNRHQSRWTNKSLIAMAMCTPLMLPASIKATISITSSCHVKTRRKEIVSLPAIESKWTDQNSFHQVRVLWDDGSEKKRHLWRRWCHLWLDMVYIFREMASNRDFQSILDPWKARVR